MVLGASALAERSVEASGRDVSAARPLTPPLLGVFFAFATVMTGLSAITLLAPGGPLDAMWRIKPDAYAELRAFAPVSGIGFAVLCAMMAAACFGAVTRRRWGWMLGAALIVANALGDLGRALTGAWVEGLIGVAITGVLLWWLWRPATRAMFDR